MNTVEALNVLGKALCGDSFEVKPGLTDAETILEIAKNYSGGGSGGGGSSVRVIDLSELTPIAGESNKAQYEVGLTPKDFAGSCVYFPLANVKLAPLKSIIKYNNQNRWVLDYTISGGSEAAEANFSCYYYPETGVLEVLT